MDTHSHISHFQSKLYVSMARVKARKQWDIQPAADRSLAARLLIGCEEDSTSRNRLSDDVKPQQAEGERPTRSIGRLFFLY
jgi:hypothetical protein